MNKTRNDLVFYCLQSAGVCVCVNGALTYEKLSMKVRIPCRVTVRDRNRQSKTGFLYYCDNQTAVQTHSGNRQRHKSLYTGFYSDTFRDGSCRRGSTLRNQCLMVNGLTLSVSTGSCYIHARVLYWMALREIALSPSAPETLSLRVLRQCILTHKYLYIYFDFISNTGHTRP